MNPPRIRMAFFICQKKWEVDVMPKPKNCYNCSSQKIKKTLVDLPYFYDITVTEVPAYQCQQCMEVVFNGTILQNIEKALENKIVKKNPISFMELLHA